MKGPFPARVPNPRVPPVPFPGLLLAGHSSPASPLSPLSVLLASVPSFNRLLSSGVATRPPSLSAATRASTASASVSAAEGSPRPVPFVALRGTGRRRRERRARNVSLATCRPLRTPVREHGVRFPAGRLQQALLRGAPLPRRGRPGHGRDDLLGARQQRVRPGSRDPNFPDASRIAPAPRVPARARPARTRERAFRRGYEGGAAVGARARPRRWPARAPMTRPSPAQQSARRARTRGALSRGPRGPRVRGAGVARMGGRALWLGVCPRGVVWA